MAKKTISKTTRKNAGSDQCKIGQTKKSKAASQDTSKSSVTCSTQVRTPMLTDEQITARAKQIWQNRGCVPGFDEQNWYEAEAQLRTELETVLTS